MHTTHDTPATDPAGAMTPWDDLPGWIATLTAAQRRTLTAALLTTDPKHRIEIAGYHDPDDEITLTVFLDGTRYDHALIDITDPGAGYPYPLSEWRTNSFHAAGAGGSPAWTAQVLDNLAAAEERGYTTDDTTPARNPQPDITDLTQLDPARWRGDGTCRSTGEQDDTEHDNTLRAGQALTALLAYHHATHQPADQPADQVTAATAARQAYHDATASTDRALGELLTDLLADIRHLADAVHVNLDYPPSPTDPEPRTTLGALLTALRHAAQTAWAEEIEDGWTWDEAEHTAHTLYSEELRGEAR